MIIFIFFIFYVLIIGFYFFEGILYKLIMFLSILNVKWNGRVYVYKLIFNENYY